MITDAELQAFCEAVDAKRKAYYEAQGYTTTLAAMQPATFERGGKNARIVTNETGSRSAFCFVDLSNGDILKSAGWKAPAKGARGNIKNGAADVGPYGAAYKR